MDRLHAVRTNEEDRSYAPIGHFRQADSKDDSKTCESAIPTADGPHTSKQTPASNPEGRHVNLSMLPPPRRNSVALHYVMPRPRERMSGNDTRCRERREKFTKIVDSAETVPTSLPIHWMHWSIAVCLQGNTRGARSIATNWFSITLLIIYITGRDTQSFISCRIPATSGKWSIPM